jgi:hypothetical protein
MPDLMSAAPALRMGRSKGSCGWRHGCTSIYVVAGWGPNTRLACTGDTRPVPDKRPYPSLRCRVLLPRPRRMPCHSPGPHVHLAHPTTVVPATYCTPYLKLILRVLYMAPHIRHSHKPVLVLLCFVSFCSHILRDLKRPNSIWPTA